MVSSLLTFLSFCNKLNHCVLCGLTAPSSPPSSLGMPTPLNFGPAEQTREQRQEIADRALAITLAEEQHAKDELLGLYDRYVAGEVDLYAISVHVGEQTRQRLRELVAAGPASA